MLSWRAFKSIFQARGAMNTGVVILLYNPLVLSLIVRLGSSLISFHHPFSFSLFSFSPIIYFPSTS